MSGAQVADPRLQWPDSLACPTLGDGGNYIYVTASQVNTLPFIKDARNRTQPYGAFRIQID